MIAMSREIRDARKLASLLRRVGRRRVPKVARVERTTVRLGEPNVLRHLARGATECGVVCVVSEDDAVAFDDRVENSLRARGERKVSSVAVLVDLGCDAEDRSTGFVVLGHREFFDRLDAKTSLPKHGEEGLDRTASRAPFREGGEDGLGLEIRECRSSDDFGESGAFAKRRFMVWGYAALWSR